MNADQIDLEVLSEQMHVMANHNPEAVLKYILAFAVEFNRRMEGDGRSSFTDLLKEVEGMTLQEIFDADINWSNDK